MRAVTDEQLIEWVAQGDASCLGTLFERHNRGIYRYCRQMTKNSTQAEDLVQDIFLRVLRKAGAYRRAGSFKAWLYHIARNVTFDQLRKAKVRGEQSLDEEYPELPVGDHQSAERIADAQQSIGSLAKALSNLPGAVREIIWLGRFEFDSYEELGQALGCKAATARVRMHRAMKQLAAEFELINGAPIDA